MALYSLRDLPLLVGGAMAPTNPQVVTFLREHPEFLERFVLTNVKLDTLERWTNRKAKRENGTHTSESCFLQELHFVETLL
jgi:hypothetical protein